jgi:recombination protein RecR
MDILPKSITRVIESFERLPGIGPKTAQRLALYLLHVPEDELVRFGESIATLKKTTKLCMECKNITEEDICTVCNNPGRDKRLICVVEQPNDVISIEKTGSFQGLYHVLHGAIDPLNNIGPDEIFIAHLTTRVKKSLGIIEEIVLATNPTMEGEATAMYIQKELSTLSNGHPIKITRLAHGLPVGADLEYADEITLKRALEGRRGY